MLTTKSETETSSVIDATSAVEVGRLFDQDQLLTKVVGGVFPERLDLTNVYRILDLACGPGGWAMEAARQLEVPCIGVDHSPVMLQYARTMAKVSRLNDIATFEHMDITHPLAFDDGSFDLIHARFLAGVLPTTMWPTVLRECFRVLKVGGSVLLTEAEWATTNSPAAQQLAHKATDAFRKARLGWSLDGHTLGVAHALPTLLRTSGGRDVQHEVHLLDFSYGQPHYTAMVRNLWTAYQLMQPFLTHMGCGSREELFTLCNQLGEDIWNESFTGGMFLLRSWARKVEAPEPEQDFFFPPAFPLIR